MGSLIVGHIGRVLYLLTAATATFGLTGNAATFLYSGAGQLIDGSGNHLIDGSGNRLTAN